MNSIRPKALIIGHSFVRRLTSDLERNFDARADIRFGLDQRKNIHFRFTLDRKIRRSYI